MWVQGDEDGGVSIVCDRPACMSPGRTHQRNPRGLYYAPVPVLPYRPNPIDVARAWSEHRKTHDNN